MSTAACDDELGRPCECAREKLEGQAIFEKAAWVVELVSGVDAPYCRLGSPLVSAAMLVGEIGSDDSRQEGHSCDIGRI